MKKWSSLFLPVLLGVAVLFLAAWSKPGPEKSTQAKKARAVRVIRLRPLDVQTRATGYGLAVPAQTWRAVARVSGTIVRMHPELKDGAVFPPGTVILQIDPAPYEIAVRQLEAVLEATRGELAQLEIQKANHEASLKIEERTLALKKKDLDREKQLFARKTAAAATVEQLEQTVLAQQAKSLSVRSSLSLIPAQRAVLLARIKQTEAQIEQAKLDVAYTEIKIPFFCRIAQRRAEFEAFVQKGQELVVADGLATQEVHAKIPADRVLPLIDLDKVGPRGAPDLTSSEKMERAGFSGATVRASSGIYDMVWEGRLDRITGEVDTTTRTLTAVVSLRGNPAKRTPGRRGRPPRGLLCEVELRGRVDKGRLVVPRIVLRDGQALVVGAGDRLERRTVRTAYTVADLVVVEAGLEAGTRVVVSDVEPAVDRTPLAPVVDEALEKRIAAEAAGTKETSR